MSDTSEAKKSPVGDKQPSEAELRAALEEQFRKVSVEDLIKQSTASLVNVAAFKAGLVPGSEQDRDLAQVELAVDAISGLLNVLERADAKDLAPLRDALSQLQLAYAQQQAESSGPATEGKGPAETKTAATEEPKSDAEQPGPAQSSGKLWVPGQ